MQSDLNDIDQAMELIRLKMAKLKSECGPDSNHAEVIDDIELALGWLDKKLKTLSGGARVRSF